MNFNIKARLFAAVAVFKAVGDIRYYLNGVYLEPAPEGGAVIVATNGHALCVWRDPSAVGVDRPIIIEVNAKLLSACEGSDLKRLVVRDDRLAVVLDEKAPGGTLTKEIYIHPIAARKHGVQAWEIEGKFPDWLKTIPKAPPHGVKGFFNLSYLGMADRAMKIGSPAANKFFALHLYQADANSAILVTSIVDADFAAVIMPVHDTPMSLPGWLKARQDTPKVEAA